MGRRSSAGTLLIMALNSGLFSKAPRLVHVSTIVPPQLELMRPTGTCNLFTSSLAKKYPIAVKSPAVAGEQVSHFAGEISSMGNSLTLLGILICRISG